MSWNLALFIVAMPPAIWYTIALIKVGFRAVGFVMARGGKVAGTFLSVVKNQKVRKFFLAPLILIFSAEWIVYCGKLIVVLVWMKYPDGPDRVLASAVLISVMVVTFMQSGTKFVRRMSRGNPAITISGGSFSGRTGHRTPEQQRAIDEETDRKTGGYRFPGDPI